MRPIEELAENGERIRTEIEEAFSDPETFKNLSVDKKIGMIKEYMFIQGMEGGKLMEEVKTDTGIQKVGTGESKTVSEYKNIMLSTATKRKIGMLPPEPQKNKGTNAITL